MTAEYNCDLCEKTYVREGNLTKHMAKHSEVERNQVGAVINVVTQVVQVAVDQVAPGPLFVDIVIPVIDDFPEMEEIDMTLIGDHEAANQIFGDIDDCLNCDDKDDDIQLLRKVKEKLLRRVEALEKSKKTLQRLHKGQKLELENARTLLEKATKENVILKQKVSNKPTPVIIEIEENAGPIVDPHKCANAREWQCEICDFSTKNKFAMKAHMGFNAHSDRPSPVVKEQTVLLRTIQCEKCDLKCFDESEMKYQMETKHSGPMPCRYGDSCNFLAQGRCKFSHRVVVEEGWEEVHRRGRKVPNKQRIPVQPCKFDEFCTKGRFCAFTHTRWSAMPAQSAGSRFQFTYNMEEDFPILNSINRKY